jgi:hypothetical protein
MVEQTLICDGVVTRPRCQTKLVASQVGSEATFNTAVPPELFFSPAVATPYLRTAAIVTDTFVSTLQSHRVFSVAYVPSRAAAIRTEGRNCRLRGGSFLQLQLAKP